MFGVKFLPFLFLYQTLLLSLSAPLLTKRKTEYYKLENSIRIV